MIGRAVAPDNRGMLPLALLAATSVAFPVYEPPKAIAISGENVLWAAPTQLGQVAVHEAPISGGRPRVVMQLPAANPRSVSLAANASGFVVAVREPGTDRVEGVFGGVRRSLVDCHPTEPQRDIVPLTVVAGRRGFALAGKHCGPAGVDLVGADGTLSPLNDVRLHGDYRVAYNEPYLAVTAGFAPPAQYVRVLDLDAGTERHVQPHRGRDRDLAVLADGSLVAGTVLGIYAWPRDENPLLTELTTSDRSAFAASETGVVYVSGQRARFASIDGESRKRIRASGSAFAPLAFDGRRAAFMHVTCRNLIQVAVVDVRRPARRPACRPHGVATR